MELKVFSTSRSIRNYYNTTDNIVKAINISEFEKRSILVEDKEAIDSDLRILLLQEACIFKDFKKLKISLEFSSFYENSTFLFKFFDEIMNEKVEIKSLKLADSYGEFDIHIDILDEILNNYIHLLNKHNLYDKINTPSIYTINRSYLLDYDKITVYLDGYLNKFELDLFDEISTIVELKVEYETNSFTKKMVTNFGYYGLLLKNNMKYLLNLSTKIIEQESKVINQKQILHSFTSATKTAQIALIQQRVYEYLKLGLKPKDIVVLTPDETLSELIELFDTNNNFNFAMGYSFRTSNIYKTLNFIKEFLLNKAELTKANKYKLDTEFLQSIVGMKDSKDSSVFINFLNTLKLSSYEENIFLEEFYSFSKLLEKIEITFFESLNIFLKRISKRTIDDSRGGGITVMGVLESRGAHFEGVIVTDFNEDIVPKKSKKDIFLSSEIKKELNLPTIKDRENLQKNYYYKLFKSSKFISVLFIEDDTNKKSRFLDELNYDFKIIHQKYNNNLENILFPLNQLTRQSGYNITLKFDLTKEYLSATKLKTFLDCKRKFYFKYIQKIQQEKTKDTDFKEVDVGNVLHSILYSLYNNQESFSSMKEFKSNFIKEVNKLEISNILNKFYIDLWVKKLNSFFDNEIERFNNGYKVLLKEEKFTTKLGKFNLVGNIDRVDKKDNIIDIIDYKSGTVKLPVKLENLTDFQSAFYYVLLEQNGFEVNSVNFYELKTGKLKIDLLINEKVMLLKEILSLYEHEIVIDFRMCEDKKKCKFCPYIHMCGRD